jgi:hypothetical protein
MATSSNGSGNGAGDVGSHDDGDVEPQEGVRQIEAVAMTWTRWGLISAYIGYVFVVLGSKYKVERWRI